MNEEYKQAGAERSAEEVSWDEEFSNTVEGDAADSIGSMLADLGQLLVQVPAAIVSMSSIMFPEDTRRHARAAARESFFAVRSLLSAVGDGIEEILTEPEEGGVKAQKPTVSGPAGTWGTARAGRASRGSSTDKEARRIEISDSGNDPATTNDVSTNGPTEDGDMPESRGMRADIDY